METGTEEKEITRDKEKERGKQIDRQKTEYERESMTYLSFQYFRHFTVTRLLFNLELLLKLGKV